MKHLKPQSLTTDTRLSQSNFFNSSLLQKTNVTTASHKVNNLTLSNTFNNNKIENKQTDFLKVKNIQLQERVKRMTEQIRKLQDNKVQLLKLNQKYVKVVNQYYKDQSKDKKHNKANNSQTNINYETRTSQKFKSEKDVRKQLMRSKNGSFFEQSTAEVILTGLEKDYRNLVKHCLVMQGEIKNYASQMEKFTQMKSELLAVNHTSPKELIAELEQNTYENKQLKKQNNRLGYQLEKSKLQSNKLKKARENQSKQLSSNGNECQKLKAEINKVTQQSNDKANQDKQTIYELELKVERLQKELRSGQQHVMNNEEKRKQLQIQRVETVHENSFLRANLSELLDPKKHPLLSLDRNFLYKKKRQPSKRISLHCSIRE